MSSSLKTSSPTDNPIILQALANFLYGCLVKPVQFVPRGHNGASLTILTAHPLRLAAPRRRTFMIRKRAAAISCSRERRCARKTRSDRFMLTVSRAMTRCGVPK